MAADINDRTVWFETDALNITATDPGYTTGMLPTRIRNDGRAMMGALARDWDRRGPTVTSGGSANAQTLTYTVAQTAIVQGDCYAFIAGFTNTGTTTLAVSGLTAKAVRLNNAALTGGEIIAGRTYVVMYDGTAYQLIGGQTSRGGLIGVQVFTTAGTSTYTPTPGALTYDAFVLGGGAGGGGCASTSSGQAALGAPGGGGGLAIKLNGLISAISGATITVGAAGAGGSAGNNNGTGGGTSSIGAVLSATGGGAGLGAAASTSFPALQSAVGAGGVGSSGDVNVSGGNGAAPGVMLGSSGGLILGGNGGSSMYSGGGIGKGVSSAGGAAAGFGGGGSGGANLASQSARAGGAGSGGLVIIVERS